MSDVVKGLRGVLADAIVFYHKMHHYHWHVTGPNFYPLHERFEGLYEKWADVVDDTAERIVTLGGQAHFTMAEAIEEAALAEDGTLPPPATMVANVIADLQSQCDRMRQVAGVADDANDRATSGLLDELIADIEKRLWMLRSSVA
ncbi:DNA starvation/stationary phase protection protein [bacterium]|nr:DNA starvation/stationary phase protection protein [bacterium]MCB9476582.1 DNA starvation/stationary phase protection protein [Deltaproteobacteria bacterium]